MPDHRSVETARGLRDEPTPAEKRLWQFLRNRQLGGLKFRRQHPFPGAIADFYCFECRLVVEVDGEVHHEPGQRERDASRDDELRARGLTVLRFWNSEVEREIQRVLDRILNAARGPEAPRVPESAGDEW